MGSVMGSSGLNIVYTSRHFQPCANTFDDRFQFVGPMTSRGETIPFPWDRVGASDVVYVSLGTLFNADTAFYRTCFEAFAGQALQVILSVGTKVSLTSLGAVPPNFVVSAHVPQLAVLQRARAFVTHGGMNSVSEGLFYGVPLVVVPQMGEQAIVGRQVEQLGAGLCLRKKEVTGSSLRESVRRLLEEERFRGQADIVRRSFLDAGGPARAADAILAFTR
jgi:MGT family glycosyltransferase